MPVRPDDALLIWRTASIGTHVGPAVTRMRRPERRLSMEVSGTKKDEPAAPVCVTEGDLLRFLLRCRRAPASSERGFSLSAPDSPAIERQWAPLFRKLTAWYHSAENGCLYPSAGPGSKV